MRDECFLEYVMHYLCSVVSLRGALNVEGTKKLMKTFQFDVNVNHVVIPL